MAKIKDSTFVCPYCFEEPKVSDVLFRCTNPDDIACEKEEDKELNRYLGASHPDMKICTPTTKETSVNIIDGIPKSVKCRRCKWKTSRIVCPKCHNDLKDSILIGTSKFFSIVGSSGTGKSIFLGVLIHMLRKTVKNFDGSLEGFNDSTRKRYKDELESKLFGTPPSLPKKTDPLGGIHGFHEPLIFELKFIRKFFFREKIEIFNLVFFDTAGENFDELNSLYRVGRYIGKSAGVIFLIDPLNIPPAADKMDIDNKRDSAGAAKAGSDDNEILERISELIRDVRAIPSSKKIKTLIAPTISKIDLVFDEIEDNDEGSILLNNSPYHEGVFDLSDCYAVSQEIEGYLQNWKMDTFLDNLSTNYKNLSFFGVSSLGEDNIPINCITHYELDKHPEPHRIEDPLLWMLKEHSIIWSKASRFNLRENWMAFNSNLRIVSNFINLKLTTAFVGIILGCLILAWVVLGFIPNNNPAAVEHLYFVSVSPFRPSGTETITADIRVIESGIGFGRPKVRSVLSSIGENREIPVDIVRRKSFRHGVGSSRTYELFEHNFDSLSDYILTIYINDIYFQSMPLQGS